MELYGVRFRVLVAARLTARQSETSQLTVTVSGMLQRPYPHRQVVGTLTRNSQHNISSNQCVGHTLTNQPAWGQRPDDQMLPGPRLGMSAQESAA